MTPSTAPIRSLPHRSRARTLALAACGAAALAPAVGALAAPAAQADSLVFVKESNVWLANPDGSGQYQVTTDGTADNPYQSPSQADDGTIVAVRAKPNLGPLIRMRQNGSVINEIPAKVMQYGPFDPAISPDGRRVAYVEVYTNTHETSSATWITNVDGPTAPSVYGSPGPGTGAPSWIDSDRIFVGTYTRALTMVPGQEEVDWWYDWDHEPLLGSSEDLDDGEVAANGTVAFVRGDRDGNTIQLYRSNGLGSAPTPTCTLSNPSPGPLGARFVDPTFSPSGDAIAWQEGDGIWTTTLPATGCAGAPRLTIPGASAPDWGPAAINPGPRETKPPTGGGQTPVVPTPTVPKPAPKPVPDTPVRPVIRRAAGGCSALRTAAKRDACTLNAALKRCASGPKKRRAACVASARRAAALKACARKSGKTARARCVARVKKTGR
ncbi:hypothetical protein VSS74_28720 [Conexibacter stalactiti]|uniref:WD40 repeat protein n=1 Tax=Conexibacter stalactiti TaxID=1940611 RepID=A0ABU4HYI0_9ACTN|nr:hypothetical protein [Conexibacter stalactiti]MDW5598377.1 hypothetical protein [Conexibacter stalactiti]MEC5039019.1 hypothetical protein [Conexibacter stalactiti]